ncbi:SDR family oxidoreductase [Enterovirga rhinocerotis]|uniref:Nucleoside-diphosphate-sugar epimerase n=1 Tax=Enterovirga rhinocerotis TaxID=1339210 RepID=A0A4R7BIK9_9HYPH|nr:SDR family oxidoreductase [Enterovirga rhinocerotis]TDR85154.1 nucleoside-diphosphate-sugar epimerase [Enterovirga rhinocerotis]
MKHALVVGGLGVAGYGIVRHLATQPDWTVHAVSRRKPDDAAGATWHSCDLLDRDAVERVLGELRDITHIFYVAYLAKPTFAEEVAPNLAMLVNAVEVVERASPGLQHVSLMQGTKAYGTHLGPYKTPARETDPRHMPPNFYYDQEDYLRSRAPTARWTWSALRPRTIYGYASNSPMNMTSVLAVYAAISKELGLPLRFPGTPGGYRALQQTVDTDLLARAAVWAATEPRCAGEIFNVTNGGLFRWEQMWPKIAEAFEMECGPVQTIRLAVQMADKAALWDGMVERYGLRRRSFAETVSWAFGDFQWHADYDSISETTKIRRFGFHEVVDDEEMLIRQMRELRALRVIP